METTMIKTPKSLRQMSLDACEKFTDNRKAVGDIHARLKNDPKLQAELTEEILRLAVAAAVEDARSSLRQGAKQALNSYPVARGPGQTPRGVETYAVNRGVMMQACIAAGHVAREYQQAVNGWVVGKVKLMDANRKQLRAAIASEQSSLNGHQRNITFYRDLDSRLTDKNRVHDIFTLADAARIWQQITRSTKKAA